MGDGLYIGRRVDPETLRPGEGEARLDPDRLTRHAVCLGMTGSGKTGLCVDLLEELALAGIPALIIDPKGDMTNLALAFREHRPEDFEPWVDPAEARREGIEVAELGRRTATLWREGLAKWGVSRERIARYADSTALTIYTPGSASGVSVDVLSALEAPPAELLDDAEALQDLVSGTVSALLGLVGEQADPVRDPSHIVLSRILADQWMAGRDADLEGLITRLVDPPFEKVGVFAVDTFFPRGDRMSLAMQLNGIVASPAFAAWRQGAPLDVDAFLAERDGRTPISVFYTAHLPDAERMFFISTLLQQVVSWSRRQAGTSSLRALVYFDEVFGYLPPHPRNPPSKRSVLTLMKQARAVGVGTMLVTQNPVDIDYKALSNAGTWWIGRLQTRQDRDRVLDGLSGAGSFDRSTVSDWLENLPSRTFVWRDVKEDEPSLVHSRWAISYLRGPLTRRELERLPEAVRTLPEGLDAGQGAEAPASSEAPAASPAAVPTPEAPAAPEGWRDEPPPAPEGTPYRFLDPRVVFSARLQEFFADAAQPHAADGRTRWRPALHAVLHVRFDERDFVEDRTEQRLFFPVTDHEIVDRGDPGLREADLLPSAPPDGLFAPLPGLIDEPSELKSLEKRVREDVYRGETTRLFKHEALDLESTAGETRDRFEERVDAALQERIDAEIRELKERVDRDVERLEERRTRLERDLAKYQTEARSRMAHEVASAAETVFGLFFGGRRKRISTVVTKRQQTMKAKERLSRTEQEIADLERAIYELENDTANEIARIENAWRAKARDIDEVEVRLERNDIRLDDFAILWVPVTRAV